MAIEHKSDLFALPCGLIWMVSLYLLPMQLIMKQYNAFSITLIIFLISLVGIYKFWYKNLPPEPAVENTQNKEQTDASENQV